MTESSPVMSSSLAVSILSFCGALCTVLGVLSGVVMLFLIWLRGEAPHVLTWGAMVLLPVGFLSLVMSLVVAMVGRKAQRGHSKS
ncbi:hypothetical protein ACN08Z_00510 [Rothia sp. P7181]|uniref:hypothetical protein n=1 Tax=unclassified Rothia (in: high G+C Gram-positive bacteria) TaxID=2689056 RepID=UPI003AD0F7F4